MMNKAAKTICVKRLCEHMFSSPGQIQGLQLRGHNGNPMCDVLQTGYTVSWGQFYFYLFNLFK